VYLSVVAPIYNEVDNLGILHDELTAVLPPLGDYEIIFVDDGSNDGSVEKLANLAAADARVKVVFFRRNFGQSAAMYAGIQHASGEIVITLDGDLQNDPADIPMMCAKLEEGYDLVHGWRKDRQDTWINRRLPSMIANWLISRTTGFAIHDLGCTLKAMRREIAQELELYGEMHRFIPILAHQRGAKCVEVVTKHRPRIHGQTKYGISRTLRVVLDLLTVKFLLDYFASPMKLFGNFGLCCGGAAAFSGVATIAMRILAGVDMTGNPLLLLTVFFALAALQFVSLGLLGEVNARIYFSGNEQKTYTVRRLLNFSESPKIRRAA